jgi:membrane-associated protease RseP (regulator of RpoE activity)
MNQQYPTSGNRPPTYRPLDMTLQEVPPWLVQETRPQGIPWLNVFLFFATIYTTLVAGAAFEGINGFTEPWLLGAGMPFSFTLLAILGIHELGHFAMSRYHGVQATWPYFIPVPTFIGTFGAMIKLKSPMPDKRALLDIGAAGPVAGFLVAVPAIFFGLEVSEVAPSTGVDGALQLGDSLLLLLAERWAFGELPADQAIHLGPVAFAGWIGLLVTALNLLPVAQLDGGHIAYAVFGKYYQAVARVTLVAMVGMGFLGWPGWYVWAILSIIFKLRHPPTLNDYVPLDRKRNILAVCCLIIFILCLIPVPFQQI